MNEIILTIIILALLVYIGVKEYFDRKERKFFTRAVIAKSLEEVTSAELVDKVENNKEEENPDLVAVEEMEDNDYLKVLKGEEHGQE